MSSSAPVATNPTTNFIQRNLIPEDSHYVRYVMQKAAHFGTSENLFLAHVVSVGFAVVAVAMSVFNTLSYLLQAPIKILLNIVQFHPLGVIMDFVVDLGDMAKSFLFVCLGATFVVAGLLFPAPIFTQFSPEYYEPREVRLEQELSRAKKEIEELSAKVKELEALQRDIILKQAQEKPRWRRFLGLT